MKYAKTTTLTLLAVLALALPAAANPAIGTNPDLLPGGELYIPFKLSTSGVLGAPLGFGNYVGQQADSVTLSPYNTYSSGFVTFEMVFDITDDLAGSPELDPDSATLLLTFHDLDFKTVNNDDYDFRETLQLSFRRDAGGPTSGTMLTIDKDNYDAPQFAAGAPGFETNNETRTYEVSFADVLNLSAADFDDMETDKEFALLVTLSSELVWTGGMGGPNDCCPSVKVENTPENIGNSFVVVGVPEPGTLALMLAGGTLALARRRRSRR